MADQPSIDNRDLTHIEAMLRDLDMDELELVEPPDAVWADIEQHLMMEDAAVQRPSVVSISSRRSRFMSPAIGLAAALLLAVAGAVLYTTRGNSNSGVLASAVLQYDAGQFDPLGATSSASVSLVNVDDQLEIEIDESDLPTDLDEDADLEVWLIEPDADGNVVDLVSLGVVHTNDGETFLVPAGYDPTVYSVVDISVEPRDGNHDHSGRSILRGALVEA
jgi:anti-sigma-K factor RskA